MKAGRIFLFACLFLWTGVSAWAIANPENRCSRVAAGAISNARYYDPELGRFIQADTTIPDLSNPQSYNRYSYCVNNPLRYTDPTGHAPSDWASTMQPGIDIYYGGYIANPSHTSTIGLFGAYMGQSVANGYNDMLRLGNGSAEGTATGIAQDIGRASGIILTVAGPASTAATRLAPTEAAVPKIAPEATPTPAAEGTALREGSFSIADWSGYPANVPKPTGPFNLLEGAEYEAARAEANAANRAMHQADPSLNGLQLHEIQPVKFGGSPTDPLNKIPLTPQQHAPVTTWWNQLQRDITP